MGKKLGKESSIYSFQEFNGDAEELTQAATELCDALDLHLDSNSMPAMKEGAAPESEGNERLLRHYVSVDVVDKPSREGREARYGFRHLLQYVTARRLLKQGFSLAKIAQYTSVVTTKDLVTALLSESQESEAELLVAAYKSSAKLAPAYAKKSPRAGRSTPKNIDPIHGMADLLKGIEDIRHDFRRDMDNLRRVSDSVEKISAVIGTSVRDGAKAQHKFLTTLEDIFKKVEKTTVELTHRIELTTVELTQRIEITKHEFRERIEKMHYEVAEKIDKLESQIIENRESKEG